MVVKLFGEGQSFADELRAALPESAVNALDMVGLTAPFTDVLKLLSIEAINGQSPVIEGNPCGTRWA